ncbi:AMP-binding protein [Sphingomonas colocasiae]|uniref:AMP-binding protein n=1 Tax=Sphingomonas colocasiae TaxID=1848973 RepID=A0ABS7PJW3_9SPHN|nr:AMP-binding protein [Sphingomonas colocasiae]MBY8821533.1 AMP-binding protein [Sphingomonas colocasiae]
MSDDQMGALFDRRRCVLRYVLDDRAERQPDDIYVVFETGESWTYHEMRERVRAKAAGLRMLGIDQGDHVALMLPDGPAALLSFFAVNYIGAVLVPLNPAFRGSMLEHALKLSDARFLILHSDLVDQIAAVETGRIDGLIFPDRLPPALPAGFDCRLFDAIDGDPDGLSPPERPIEPWDPQTICYTSGTTGPSKGVISSYFHCYQSAGPDAWPFVGPDDRFLVNMPIFHFGGIGLPIAMLIRGGSIVLMEKFSTAAFWPLVRRTRCTVAFLIGAMANFLSSQPADDGDRRHDLKTVVLVPLPADAAAFEDRFGVTAFTLFNMTEISSPIVSGPHPSRAGTCGVKRDGVDVRLVDGNDIDVATGDIGEMIVRTDLPWALNSGYLGTPDATARAWRNGWFHTGDLFRRDEDGFYYFVDRVKDAIRRRGENISSFEVEREILAYPGIREAAAVGVPSPLGEQEVMAVLSIVDEARFDPGELTRFLQQRLPHFMVPRYIRLVDALPKTPSLKVKKGELRDAGVTEDCWDAATAGLIAKRRQLG